MQSITVSQQRLSHVHVSLINTAGYLISVDAFEAEKAVVSLNFSFHAVQLAFHSHVIADFCFLFAHNRIVLKYGS